MEILSFENIGTGTVQDISYDGSTLLLLNTTEAPPITYNINLLKVSENENQLDVYKRQVLYRGGSSGALFSSDYFALRYRPLTSSLVR